MSNISKYINHFTDFGFKKLFGEKASKVYLIDFLNSVFEGFIPNISELTYHKNKHLGLSTLDRNVIFDLYCKDKDQNRFIAKHIKISLFIWARLIRVPTKYCVKFWV